MKNEQIADKLAEGMGWGKRTSNIPGFLSPSETPYEQWENGPYFLGRIFQPEKLTDDADFAVKFCFKNGLGIAYANHLARIAGKSDDSLVGGYIEIECLLATPEQKTRAALAALTGDAQ